MQIDWMLLLGCSAGAIGLIEWAKTFDKEEKLKWLYKLMPLVTSVGIGLAVTMQNFEVGQFVVNSLIILSFSVLGYTTIVNFVKKKIETLLSK